MLMQNVPRNSFNGCFISSLSTISHSHESNLNVMHPETRVKTVLMVASEI